MPKSYFGPREEPFPWRRVSMDSLQTGFFLALAGLLLGGGIAFGTAAVLLRRQLRKIGTLPDLNKKLRAREVQLSMMRNTADERRDRIRQLLDELEQQSEETITCLLIEDLALESLAEIEGALPDNLRSRMEADVIAKTHRRRREDFSSLQSIRRRLEMIQNCRRELDLPTDSSSLPYPGTSNPDVNEPRRLVER
eukprot:gene456-biopygen30